MSLNGMMRTGVSGMNAQANRLSTVAENIANSDTTGYKRASTEFSSLILPGSGGNYNSGGVTTDVRYNVYKEGELEFTNSKTDLAIKGNGFFIVEDGKGDPYLTRAGSFVRNGEGHLLNAAGFTLMGYPYDGSQDPSLVINGFDGLEPINLAQSGLASEPSTAGDYTGNLPSNSTAGTVYKSSLVTYDNVGNAVLVDLSFVKTTVDNEWELTITDRESGAILNSPAPVPPAVFTPHVITFDPATGSLSTGGSMTFNLNEADPDSLDITMDFSGMQSLGYPFDPDAGGVNGAAPSKLVDVVIDEDGTVFGQYENGNLEPLYKLALATVQSPDRLKPLAGNVYTQGVDSGVIITGFANSGSFGEVISGALEGSNVDIAEELTSMIESQRSYTANSKVFQTGSDLMEILVNLKR